MDRLLATPDRLTCKETLPEAVGPLLSRRVLPLLRLLRLLRLLLRLLRLPGRLWSTKACLVPARERVCLTTEEILPREAVTPVSSASPGNTGLTSEGDPALPGESAGPEDLLQHGLPLPPAQAVPLDGGQTIGDVGDGLVLGPVSPGRYSWGDFRRLVGSERMVAVVHLVGQHGTVLGQLARRHGLGVEGPGLGGGDDSRLGTTKLQSEN